MNGRTVIFGALGVCAAAACGGKAVIDEPLGSGGASASVNSSSAVYYVSAGTTMDTCGLLEASYRDALVAAKACDPNIQAPVCTKTVPSSLTNCCPEATYVNATATEIEAVYKQLSAAYSEAGCGGICDGCPPQLPKTGVCDAASNSCVDAEIQPD